MMIRNRERYPFEIGYPQLTAKLEYSISQINAALVSLMSNNEPGAGQLLRELNPALNEFIDINKHPIYRKRSDSSMLYSVIYYGGDDTIEDYKTSNPASHECAARVREFLAGYYIQ